MTANINKPDKHGAEASMNTELDEKQESKKYNAWDDGFRVSLLLLLVIGLPLFLTCLYFVLYIVFVR